MTTVVDSKVVYADALTNEDVDYGTGYYLTRSYSDGHVDIFGPFSYEEDAFALSTVY